MAFIEGSNNMHFSNMNLEKKNNANTILEIK